ncbi:SDR family oxidoreductase [Paenibacillus sp. HN-1]|uniref:SDR family oxidoreductase n=1 Tax=Paenibacillus TaxID=44249 RepID=UPI001CA89D86|nr:MULTISPECIES: SDR family oxidoreductase [Paenibacillus]MBY9081620.1 SDR family oxidoreductase [Paenibacillus sp. CGMCC 1.18879]MBY9083489.1 SDR family oxidoreductase [Paenibacillus sinensis]
MKSLQGKIALVTGASRGAGKGIALELAESGAFVYVTGRSVKGNTTGGRPGDIDTTVSEIRNAGGAAEAVPCDHRQPEDTERLISRIASEKGRLDILVNNVWGGNELSIDERPFWEQPMEHWDTMFNGGVRAQLLTNVFAVPLMRDNPGSLIVHTTFWDRNRHITNFYYDLAKNALVRMAQSLAKELASDRIAVIPLSPGWMRTELVLQAFGTDEEHWRQVEALRDTESPRYIGRAVCALAGDPNVMERSGKPQQVGRLALEYGFTDIDGRLVPEFTVEE